MTAAGEPPLSQISPVGLTTDEIRALQFEPVDITLWEDVASVARAFWESGCKPVPAHHLLMTVGNFKRQGGTIIRLKKPLDPGRPAKYRPECKIDGLPLECEHEETWQAFAEQFDGFGVATTTTLLSALWPGRHVIIDRRARDALVGLRGLRLNDWYVRVKDSSSPMTELEVTWKDYGWYLPHVRDTAQNLGVEAVGVERALFEVDRRHTREFGKANEASWNTFGEQLVSIATETARLSSDQVGD